MTDIATGSRSGLSYLVESTFGTTPAGNFAELPFSSHSLNLAKERVQGNDLQKDRMSRVDRHGNKQTGGDVVVDLRDGVYDTFLESALMGTWDTSPATAPDILKIGTTPKWFSVEDAANDINQFRLFTGLGVNTFSVSMAPNQMVTATFGFVGKDMTISGTGKTVDAATVAQPFDAYSGDMAIGNVGAASTVANVTAIDFTLTNNLSPAFVVGSDATPCITSGMASIEGNISVYFQNADIYNRFINETESELTVSVNDPTGANQYTFGFPKIKLNGGDVPVGDDGPRVITMPFVGLYDSTTNTNFYIERPETA